MSTSGETTLTFSALQIINKAFGKIDVKVAEQDLEDDELQDGIDALNLMKKSWGAQGLHLWTKDEGVLFLDVGKTDFNLGPTGDEACQFDDFISTTSTAAKVATDTIIDVTDSANMVAGDKIGVELDDNNRHWTTILNVNSSIQVTLTDALPSASKSGSTIFTFTNLINRPQRVLSCRRKKFGQDNEIPVLSWSRDEYFNQVNKLSRGTVVNCYYSPQLGNGRMYVWQTASTVNDLLRFTFERPMDIITKGDDSLDIPEEWYEAVIYGLAFRLADDYNTPLAKADRIGQKATNFLDDLLGWDEEMESLNLQPDFN